MIYVNELPLSMVIPILIIAFILGSVFGSFINCQAGRIAEKKDWIHGHSECDTCGHGLEFLVFNSCFLIFILTKENADIVAQRFQRTA